MTKLRISVHGLPVETGRYNNVQYEDRVCRLCNLNEVGNEQHYLMSCSNEKFANLRNVFIDNLYIINNAFRLFRMQDLFYYVLAMHDRSIMKLVSKYIYDILTVFDTCSHNF